jgi:hypothetical protein
MLGGKVEFPRPGHHTPSTAIVTAYVGNREIKIDFVSHVLGVNDAQLERDSVIARFQSNVGKGEIEVPIMNPLHCFQSRVTNVIGPLRRSDATAMRQLNASPIVLQAYVSELLDAKDTREAQGTLAGLFHFLRTNPYGRDAHLACSTDPADILRHFSEDPRLDERFRKFNLSQMHFQLMRRRKRLQQRR